MPRPRRPRALLSTCSEIVIGTAGLLALVGKEPVIAQHRMQGLVMVSVPSAGNPPPTPRPDASPRWVRRRDRQGEAESDVEEDSLVFALDLDVETVDDLPVAFRSLGDQGRPTALPFDQVDHRIGGIGLGLVIEIEPCVAARY